MSQTDTILLVSFSQWLPASFPWMAWLLQ